MQSKEVMLLELIKELINQIPHDAISAAQADYFLSRANEIATGYDRQSYTATWYRPVVNNKQFLGH